MKPTMGLVWREYNGEIISLRYMEVDTYNHEDVLLLAECC